MFNGERAPTFHKSRRGEPQSRNCASLDMAGGDVEGILGQPYLALEFKVVDRRAQALSHQHEGRPEYSSEDSGIGPEHIRVRRPSKSHDVTEHEGIVIGGVVQQLLDVRESIRRKRLDIVSGRTSDAQPGSMPVAWNEEPPSVHAFSNRSTTCGPALGG